VLRGARLVKARRDGRQRLCALDVEPLRALDAWLDAYRREWQGRLARLKQYAESK
jgi:DNA-binding transcriptional ArsR family regulator